MADGKLPSMMLVDPVCGDPVTEASIHKSAHQGALLYFCSQACCARFVANPLRFIEINRLQRDVPAPVETESRQYAGLRGLFAEWLLAWSERRHVVRASKELLALYRSAVVSYPELAGRELFQRVVMHRTGCDSMAADAILERAQESFAEWPARRELTFCDVVHYLSVTEFFAAHQRQQWTHSNMTSVVASLVPHDLCTTAGKS